jgi:hypothetical protein
MPAISHAQGMPEDNVGKRHPNLQAAQQLCTQAYQKLVASQQAHEFDEGGHAQKAKDMLDKVNREIAAAAQFDNTHHK